MGILHELKGVIFTMRLLSLTIAELRPKIRRILFTFMDAVSSSSPPTHAPTIFGKARNLLGWQGFTFQIPDEWNPGKFSGTRNKGDLRIDDPNGVRIELRWEKTSKAPDVQKSVDNFLKQLEKNAKKNKTAFTAVSNPQVVSKHRKKKDQVTSFGWIGEPDAPASCGYGAAWTCPDCGRIIFTHLLGQKNEKSEKVQKLANEIFTEMECHGEGGWDTWSAFDFRVDIPVEFELKNAKILLNKLDLEWIRPRPIGFHGWGKRPERLRLQRFPVANVLLDGRTLETWSDWNIISKNKQLSFKDATEHTIKNHEGLLYIGHPKDPKSRISLLFFDKILRRVTPAGETLVWNCTESNRIFAFEHEVSNVNVHVPTDVLDGLSCH
jgi:hypothetical protein